MLREGDVARIRAMCDARIPPEACDEVRVELEPERQAINIVERRAPWRDDLGPEWSRLPVARLRYVAAKGLWTLYYLRHTGRWERYPLLGPTRRLDELLAELAEDPICLFWHCPDDNRERAWSTPTIRRTARWTRLAEHDPDRASCRHSRAYPGSRCLT